MHSRRSALVSALVFFALLSWLCLALWTTRSPPPSIPHEDVREPEDETDFWSWEGPSRFSHSVSENDTGDICSAFPTYIFTKIQVVLKIGASEPSERIHAQIASVTKCIPNLIVMSDLEQELGQYHAHDIIATLPKSYRVDNPDFDAYDAQKSRYVAGRLEPGELGWRLDRFKFLPMVERAYEMNMGAQWFVFLEADTYIVWDNLIRLLEHFDPSTPLYMGSPSPGRRRADGQTVWFAYGGTGFVLSTAAVQALLSRKIGSHGEYVQPPLNEQYEEVLKRDCCGDSVLGWALFEKGVNLSGLWPLFNPHPVHGVPFSEAYWCQPVISMHKSFPKDMINLSKWEQSRSRERPLLYADLINYTRLGNFDKRTDWDNADWDGFREPDTSPAHSSFDACRLACYNHTDCFQFTYMSPGMCTFSRSMRLGAPKGPESDESGSTKRFTSGWHMEKIQDWIQKHPCKEPVWVKPSIERIF